MSEWDEALRRLTVVEPGIPCRLRLIVNEPRDPDERRFLIALGVTFIAGLGMWAGVGYLVWKAVS